MAFGVKYRHEFYDNFGNTVRVDLLNDGYSGAVTEVDGGASPVLIHWLGEDNDKFTSIVGSEATISFISDSDEKYIDIFTSAVRQWMVKVYWNVNGSLELFWQGYIDAEEYDEPYLYYPYESVFHAYDGLGELKTRRPDFTYNFSVGILNPVNSIIYYIAQCLKQIGFELDIYVANDIIHDVMDTGYIFQDTHIDFRTFRDDPDNFQYAYDILQKILEPFGARIYQYFGRWYIDRIHYKGQTSVTYVRYNYNGTYQSNSSINTKVALTGRSGSPLCVFIEQAQVLSFDPALRDFTIEQNLESRENILPHSNWAGVFTDEDFSNKNTPIFWQKNGSVDVTHYTGDKFFYLHGGIDITSGYAVHNLSSTAGSLVLPIYYNYINPGLDASVLKFDLTLNYSPPSLEFAGGTFYATIKMVFTNAQFFPAAGNVRALIFPGAGTVTLYCNAAAWGTAWHSFEFNDSLHGDEGFREHTGTTVGLEIDSTYSGTLTYQVLLGGWSYTGENYTQGCKVKAVKLALNLMDFSQFNIYPGHTDSFTEVISENNRQTETYNISFGDDTILYNNKKYNRYHFLTYDSGVYATTQNWGTPGNITDQGLVHGVLRNVIAANYRTPMRKLTGNILSEVYGMNKELTDGSGRVYMCNGAELDMKFNEWNGEWVQLYQTEAADGGAFDEQSFSTAFDI